MEKRSKTKKQTETRTPDCDESAHLSSHSALRFCRFSRTIPTLIARCPETYRYARSVRSDYRTPLTPAAMVQFADARHDTTRPAHYTRDCYSHTHLHCARDGRTHTHLHYARDGVTHTHLHYARDVVQQHPRFHARHLRQLKTFFILGLNLKPETQQSANSSLHGSQAEVFHHTSYYENTAQTSVERALQRTVLCYTCTCKRNYMYMYMALI